MKTFVCQSGTYSFQVMPFGLMNAPSTNQRAMDALFKDLPFIPVYVDNAVIFFKNHEDHVRHMNGVLDRVASYNLWWKISKCEFMKQEEGLL